MAGVRPADVDNDEGKQRKKTALKTKITHMTVVSEGSVLRHLSRDTKGPVQVRRKYPPTKKAAMQPSPPTTPYRQPHRSNHNESTKEAITECPNSTSSRPGSALSAYLPLPSIGDRKSDVGIMTSLNNMSIDTEGKMSSGTSGAPRDQTNSRVSIPTKKVSLREMRGQQFARRQHAQPSSHSLGDEPRNGEERFLIAVRLPKGKRLQRHFRPTDAVGDIVLYAEMKMHRSFRDCNLFTSDVPKRLLGDRSQTIEAAGLGNRTLLYLEVK